MTRFRMLLVVVGSAILFTFFGSFMYKAVGLDSPVGSCVPVGNSSPVGDMSPLGNCNGTPTTISNSLSGGGQSGQVITVPSGTAVTDQATLSATSAPVQPDVQGANSGQPSAP